MSKQLARRRVQAHRVSLGMSPEQYGLVVGVSGMTVRRVEQGYVPFLSTQKKFAKALETDIPDLFGMPRLVVRRPKEMAA